MRVSRLPKYNLNFKINPTINLSLNKIWKTRNENVYNKIGGNLLQIFRQINITQLPCGEINRTLGYYELY